MNHRRMAEVRHWIGQATLTFVLFLGIAAGLVFGMGLLFGNSVQAQEKKSDYSQKIDFEDQLVEGINKQPLNSLSQISELERRKRDLHLYNKRLGFQPETQELIRELRYIQ